MNATARPTLLSLAPDELALRVVELGGRPFHARVARAAVLGRGTLDYEAMTSLPAALREVLAAELPILSGREAARSVADDGTTKLLVAFSGPAERADCVETVHIPPLGASGTKGATLCVSSQVGCPVGCPFCASGLDGLVRNLEAHEIVEQYVRGRSVGPLARSVVMGIGEPLLNASNLSRALDVVHDEMGLGARKLTVSTVGFPDRVRRAAETRPRFQLAISLHTPDDEQRARLVPAMAGVPIDEVLAAGDDWFRITGREVTYEYVLLAGVNDSTGHAERLARRLAGRRAVVNLILYNPSAGIAFERPSEASARAFRARLEAAGVVATVRRSRGLGEAAACGQLRSRTFLSRGRPARHG